MAVNFPGSPTDQQVFTDTVTGNMFLYFSTPGVWKNISYTSGYNKVTISSTAPASPITGDWWFYQDAGELYIYYNNSEWITATGGGGINNANNALTANNASYLGGVAAAGYVNATSLSAYASLSGSTFTGNVAFTSNVSISNTRITANGSTGTAGQTLISGGTSSNVYWGAGGSSNAKIHAISMFIGG